MFAYGHIFKLELTEFPDRLDIGYEMEYENKNASNILVREVGIMALPVVGVLKTGSESRCLVSKQVEGMGRFR